MSFEPGSAWVEPTLLTDVERQAMIDQISTTAYRRKLDVDDEVFSSLASDRRANRVADHAVRFAEIMKAAERRIQQLREEERLIVQQLSRMNADSFRDWSNADQLAQSYEVLRHNYLNGGDEVLWQRFPREGEAVLYPFIHQ